MVSFSSELFRRCERESVTRSDAFVVYPFFGVSFPVRVGCCVESDNESLSSQGNLSE